MPVQVRRRHFLHLMPSAGAALIAGCRDPGPATGDGSDDGGSSDGDGDGGSTGMADGGDTQGGSDGPDDGGSDESEGSGETGEPTECTEWWLCDNYGPVDGDLEVEGDALQVEGSLPPELTGMFVRNGPNPGFYPSSHWFLGDGMLHGITLSRGTATGYRARYVDTPILGVEPGPPTGPPALADHQANTSIVWHGNRLLALSEAGLPYEVARGDLATIGTHDYGGMLSGPMTAHPKIDPATGEMVFFGYHILEPAAHIHFVDPGGTLTRSETVPLAAPTMMHEFQLTATHVVLLDFPIAFDLDLAINGAGLPFRWMPENGARIGVMPRDGTADDVAWFDTELGFVFHTFNAFNDPDNADIIYVDGIFYSETWVTGPDDFAVDGQVVRFTIDTVGGTVTRDVLLDRMMEFPQIDARRRGMPHRYGYAVGGARPPQGGVQPADTIIKLDLEGRPVSHTLADGLLTDEVTFVPASPTSGEDEGWLISYAYEPGADTSRLIVLDATDITAGPIASVHLPRRVPYGFHGIWVPA